MAVALTPFEGMCGFRPLEETAAYLQLYPEVATVVGQANATALTEAVSAGTGDGKTALKQCFAALMTADASLVKDQRRVGVWGSTMDLFGCSFCAVRQHVAQAVHVFELWRESCAR